VIKTKGAMVKIAGNLYSTKKKRVGKGHCTREEDELNGDEPGKKKRDSGSEVEGGKEERLCSSRDVPGGRRNLLESSRRAKRLGRKQESCYRTKKNLHCKGTELTGKSKGRRTGASSKRKAKRAEGVKRRKKINKRRGKD